MQENWSQELIRIHKNIDLNIIRTGNDDKPPLILAHGLSDMGLCWQPLASNLEVNYDIIMFDAYGHGKSSKVDPQSRFDLVEDLHDLIKELKIEKPAIIGHSMGAYTLARFAAKHPDIPSAIVLEDPPWTETPLSAEQAEEMRKSFRQNNRLNQEKSLKALIISGFSMTYLLKLSELKRSLLLKYCTDRLRISILSGLLKVLSSLKASSTKPLHIFNWFTVK